MNAKNDYPLLKELFIYMLIPKEHHDDIIREEIIENNKEHIRDYIDIDSKAYPECGNVGFTNFLNYYHLLHKTGF